MSVFLSKSEIDELIANNILELIHYRDIKGIDKTIILNIIKNRDIKVFNNFLIGYVNEKELNTFINKINNYKYTNGIMILSDINFEKYDFSKDTLYKKNINIFTKDEFYEIYVKSTYYQKHVIISEEEFKKSFPNILINQLPLITHWDKAVRYIGGKIGEIVKIYRHNVSGESIYYRLIK